jgi:hypothetical protein
MVVVIYFIRHGVTFFIIGISLMAVAAVDFEEGLPPLYRNC